MKQVSQRIPFSDILADDQARRVSSSRESLDALKSSIAAIGLLDPLIVEALPSGKYRLCAGRNRYTALKALLSEGKSQFDEISCTVLEFDDHELLDENYKNYKISQVIFDSNDKRSQLTKFEQARHYAAQKHQFPHLFKNDEELAKFNNKPVNEVVEALRLLAIDQAVVDKVEELNLQEPNTIPFMCLEEIAEAAALPKRPLPPDGQMHVVELLISSDLPDKRALVARDKMHILVNNVRKEFAPDPRGRKPKLDPESSETSSSTEESLFGDDITTDTASGSHENRSDNGYSTDRRKQSGQSSDAFNSDNSHKEGNQTTSGQDNSTEQKAQDVGQQKQTDSTSTTALSGTRFNWCSQRRYPCFGWLNIRPGPLIILADIGYCQSQHL